MTILMIFFLISYFNTFLEGPGYLPFYYPYKFENNNDYLSGLVTNDEQFIYLKNRPMCYRCGFFKSTKRIVIRPDH